jgi:hypothetical protein
VDSGTEPSADIENDPARDGGGIVAVGTFSLLPVVSGFFDFNVREGLRWILLSRLSFC